MITAYEARCVWLYTGLGDSSDYPGKVRALCAAYADRAAISCYRARRFVGLPALLADLLTAALWAVFPILRAPAVPEIIPEFRATWPAGWTLRPSDRLSARRTTGPPARGLWSSAPGVLMS